MRTFSDLSSQLVKSGKVITNRKQMCFQSGFENVNGPSLSNGLWKVIQENWSSVC